MAGFSGEKCIPDVDTHVIRFLTKYVPHVAILGYPVC